MTINKFNYEAFALDYLEGALSPDLVEEMERFLKTHPAIEAELSGMMELITLEPDTSIVYEGKKQLLQSEKVVWLQSRWVHPLLVAASILLILSTFFAGYQTGLNNGEILVVNEQPIPVAKDQKTNLLAEKNMEAQTKEVIKAPSLPLKAANKTVATASKEGATIASTAKVEQTASYLSTKSDKIALEQELISPLVQEQEILVKVEPKPVNINLPKREIHSTTFLVVTITPITSQENEASSLEEALVQVQLMDRQLLASYQKPKRSFKDLLGRFPVNNLKEALIPSYYRDDIAGQ